MGAQTHIRNANARHVRELAAPTQRKARPQDGRPNAKLIRNENVHTREHEAKRRAGGWIRTNFGLEVDFLIRPHQGWAPQRNTRHVRELAAPTQRKARPQDGRPNAKLIRNENVHTREHEAKRRAGGWIRTNFGLEVDFLIRPHQGWAPQRNARHVRKFGAPTHVRNANARHVRASASYAPQRISATQTQGTSARPQDGRPNARPQCKRKARPHVRKLGTPTHVRNANARHVRKLGAPTHVCNANARHVRKLGAPTRVRTSASWAPQRTSATQT